MFFKRHNQSRFLYSLDVELLRHWYNLQRAADGKSAFYVPTSRQHIQIADEQARLASMGLGTQVLARIWAVEPKSGKEIPIKTRGLLTKSAYRDAARALNDDKIAPHTFESFTLTEVAGLEDLLHYLDAKRCLMGEVGEPCPEYASISKNIGFIPSVNDSDKKPRRTR